MSNKALLAPRESATVALLREHQQQLQVLMLQKHAALNYGGSWVFPGGMVEPGDIRQVSQSNKIEQRNQAALIAAVRETEEETGLRLDANNIKPFSNWLTPKFRIKRYNTLFLIGQLSGIMANNDIAIDGEEIVASQWIQPAKALAAQANGEMVLTGPSFVTLSQLAAFNTSDEAITAMLNGGIAWYEPRGLKTDTGVATIYQGDAAYQQAELSIEALLTSGHPHHRLYMHNELPWEFTDSR